MTNGHSASSDRACWYCNRDLGVSIAPKDEAVILMCSRCGEFTSVQAGRPARQATGQEVATGLEERRQALPSTRVLPSRRT